MRSLILIVAIAVGTPVAALANVFAADELAMECAMARILEVRDRPFTNPHNRDPAEVIETSLSRRLYHISARNPGSIEAFYAARDVRADITVTYTDSTYSILYRDSTNLRYGNGRIDQHYNRWVNNLDHDLQLEFTVPAPPPRVAPPAPVAEPAPATPTP
jgi:hypothetical protein